mgnify:CR=1 FL=1
MLQLNAVWFKDNHKFVSWSNESSHLLKNTKDDLYRQTKSQLSRRCSHIAGHGGVKGSIRYCQRLCNNFKYVARFDIQYILCNLMRRCSKFALLLRLLGLS